MNKVIKLSVILGVIFCLMGVGMITAGAMMGGINAMDVYMGNAVGSRTAYYTRKIVHEIKDEILDEIWDFFD